MKKNLFVTIAVMAMSVFTVNAQTVVKDSISTSDFAACKHHLDAHPADTIRTTVDDRKLELVAEKDTVVTRNSGKTVIDMKKGDKLYLAGVDVWKENGQILRGDHYVVVRLNVLPLKYVADSVLVEKVDAAAERTQVALISRSFGQKQDINFYSANVHKRTNGKVVDKAMNKNGLSFFVDGGYRFGESSIHSFTGEAGLELTADWGAALMTSFRFGTGVYPDNAVEAGGSYLTYGFKVGGGWGWELDKYAVFHLYLLGGIGLDFQRTETAENQYGLLQSKVSALYPWARIKLAYEPFNWRVGTFFSLGWEQNQILTQNMGNAGKNCVTVEIGLKVPLFRSWVKTTTK